MADVQTSKKRSEVLLILILSALVGVGFWLLDTVVDYYWFNEAGLELAAIFLSQHESHDFYMRTAFVFVSVFCGVAVAQYFSREITGSRVLEEQHRLDRIRYECIQKLNQMQGCTIQEVMDYALEAGVEITGSAIGYIYFYSEKTEMLTLYAWSRDVMPQCHVMDPQTDYELFKTGIWGEAVRQRRPIITNDYAAPHPHKKGLPEGHVPLTRHMNVPVMDAGEIVALIGVGNSPFPYTDAHVRHLTLLMDGVWKLKKRIEMDAEVRRLNQELEERVRDRTRELEGAVAEITQYAKAQEVLLREVNHRVKNNLAALVGLLHLEEDRALRGAEAMPAYLGLLRDLTGRIRGLSAVHNLLSAHDWRPLPLAELCTQVVQGVLQNAPTRLAVELYVQETEVTVPSNQAHHLTMILNELAMNTVKYGLSKEGAVQVSVNIKADSEAITLVYGDQGNGFPATVLEGETGDSIGMELIHGITKRSLCGSVHLENTPGATTTIRFPLHEEKSL